MNKLIATLISTCALSLCAATAMAATSHGDKELQAACKGLAIGKYCGMKHEH